MSESTPTPNDLGLPKLKELMDKNFWTRPEGAWGKGILLLLGVVLAAGVVISAPAILAYILAVLTVTTSIVYHAIFLAAVYFVTTNKMLTRLAGIAFRSFVRGIAQWFVDMNPVAVARDLIARSKERLEKANEALKRYKTKMVNLMQTVKVFQKKFEQQQAAAQQLLRQGEKDLATGKAESAEHTKQRIDNLTKAYQKMEMVCRVLDTMLKKAKLKVTLTEENFEDQITEFLAMKDVTTATAEVKAAVQGSATDQELAGMAAAKMALDIANAVVEIDDLVSVSSELFSDVDSEQAVFSERAMAKIEQWEKQSQSNVLGPGEKQAIIDLAHDPNETYDTTTASHDQTNVNSGQQFDVNKLFR